MGIPRDVSPFGSQTVTGPGWPEIDEEQLASAAAEYEAFAAKLAGSVVPQQTSQLTSLAGEWTGLGATAASGEATSIIGGHEANAAQATATAVKLRAMEAAVVRTKALVNATALEVQRECELLAAMPVGNAQELIQSRIKMGLSQNIAYVNANTAELAASLGTPPVLHNPGAPPTASAQQAGQKGGEQATQMMGQMIGMAAQLPGQLMGMVAQAPQQLMQPLQQLSQPLQQLTSLFGGKGGAGGAASPSPFSAFSNHPLAGGSGAGGGGGMTKAASVPGSGGSLAQTPAMANLVGSNPGSAPPLASAGGGAIAGLAPVASGAGNGMGMMPHRGGEGTGGTATSLAPPAALDYDLDEDLDDDW